MRVAATSSIALARSANGASAARGTVGSCANSRNNACSTICSSCASGSPFNAAARARRPKRSTWPTRRKDGETRHVIAQGSRTISSGSFVRPMSSLISIRRISGGKCASRGSSTSGKPSSPPLRFAAEYHGRWTVSPSDTMSDNARVVATPNECIASEARNSRIDERSTARPSAPRQNGVVPPPFSCSSQRPLAAAGSTAAAEPGPARVETTTSAIEMARPSP
mmetsp:Transcript_79549/g.221337  ORF Transcript_79549/g.221337 Transcript_79549/m.221337 type:complete len:223 (-) Transcript_79549:342-1010(-)